MGRRRHGSGSTPWRGSRSIAPCRTDCSADLAGLGAVRVRRKRARRAGRPRRARGHGQGGVRRVERSAGSGGRKGPGGVVGQPTAERRESGLIRNFLRFMAADAARADLPVPGDEEKEARGAYPAPACAISHLDRTVMPPQEAAGRAIRIASQSASPDSSSAPVMMFRFCTAAPDAPLPRLSRRATSMSRVSCP